MVYVRFSVKSLWRRTAAPRVSMMLGVRGLFCVRGLRFRSILAHLFKYMLNVLV